MVSLIKWAPVFTALGAMMTFSYQFSATLTIATVLLVVYMIGGIRNGDDDYVDYVSMEGFAEWQSASHMVPRRVPKDDRRLGD